MIYITVRLKVEEKTRRVGVRVRYYGFANTGAGAIEAHEARKGTAVRVREDHWKTEFSGKLGTVRDRWGDSDHAAVDVLMEDGRLELFWLPSLDVVDRDIAV